MKFVVREIDYQKEAVSKGIEALRSNANKKDG